MAAFDSEATMTLTGRSHGCISKVARKTILAFTSGCVVSARALSRNGVTHVTLKVMVIACARDAGGVGSGGRVLTRETRGTLLAKLALYVK